MFDESNITKKSDLINNNSVSSYLNFSSQQNEHCYEAFYILLEKTKPKRILEIGTGMGGLTRYLKFISKEIGLDLDILTFETKGRIEHQNLIEDGINLRLRSIFDKQGIPNEEKLDMEAIEFIQKEGTTIVLCDGGNKIHEFNSIAKYIKQHDIIMAHDYSYDEDTFKDKINKKYWNWFEISESQIFNACEKYNLKPFLQEIFDKAVWVCKIKE